nr:MAG TPA_asm: hypothetical protein [Bacteriophage sp.]
MALAYFLLRGGRLFLNDVLLSGYDVRSGVASVLIFYNTGMVQYRWRFYISWQGR